MGQIAIGKWENAPPAAQLSLASRYFHFKERRFQPLGIGGTQVHSNISTSIYDIWEGNYQPKDEITWWRYNNELHLDVMN